MMWGMNALQLPCSMLSAQPARLMHIQSAPSLRESWLALQRPKRLQRSDARHVQAVAERESAPSSFSMRTVPTPRLTPQDVVDSLYDTVPDHAWAYKAFFSSEMGGIVTDPALMMVHVDDRMVHRGSGVFDTAQLINGHLYLLEPHLQRLLASAAKAQVPLPMGVRQLRRTILETAAASKCLHGSVRIWLSTGRAGFGLSPLECERSALYIAVYEYQSDLPVLQGWRVKTSPIDAKSPFFATLKSVDYLQNALCLLDAQQSGYDQGIFLDAEGYVAEGPNMNLGIVTYDDELVVPSFDNSLNGITVQRLMELVPQYRASGELPGITSVTQRRVTLEEAKQAREVFLAGSSLPVMPVVAWDETAIGDGTPGVAALALRHMLLRDAEEVGEQHTEVPYGYLTGML